MPAQKQYAIEYVAPQLLRPDIQNPRKITEKAKAALKRGIEHHGLVQPLIARRHDNLLIGGHQRLEAAIELKMATVLKELGTWRQTLMWVKDTLVLGRSDYHARHEPIFTGAAPEEKPQKGRRATQSQPVHYGWTPGAPHHFVKDRTIDTVWEVPRPRRSQEHPTMKPVELIRRAIRNSTEPGALIIDPFAGSGSTLIAAEQTGRTAYVFELDPKYADVVRERYRLYLARRAGRNDATQG